MRKVTNLVTILTLASVLLAACGAAPPAPADATASPAPTAGGQRLQAILDRGNLICGAHGTFQGFGFLDTAGNWSGFDADFCRAWAAALFNDANAVEFRSLSAQDRFTALQSGEVDVLARNSTWTLVRDVELGLTFGPVTFYDGQAIMARADVVGDASAGLTGFGGGRSQRVALVDRRRRFWGRRLGLARGSVFGWNGSFACSRRYGEQRSDREGEERLSKAAPGAAGDAHPRTSVISQAPACFVSFSRSSLVTPTRSSEALTV